LAVNPDKLNEIVGKFAAELGASMQGAAVLIGDQLGLYKALSGGAMTPEELAKKTGTAERYIREWLAGQAAGGYVTYDSATKKYMMTPEQAFTLANEDSPVYIPGAFYLVSSVYKDRGKLADAFRSGKGVGWHEHHNDLFLGTHKFFRPGYLANLVGSWLPSLDGVVSKLEAGALVADVGCGYGSSTVIMAKAFPKSRFIGYDYHLESIEWAKNVAVSEGVSGNTTFEVAMAKDYPRNGFDLVTFFDCLHDMGDPVGAAKHVHQSLKPDGTWMIVEPYSNEHLEENLNPVGRIFYNASSMICVPSSLAQEVGLAVGAQAGDSKIGEIASLGGFKRFRRATQTPFNRVFEARP
jgi:2-polyprenyl-3-methyl-5-hydroxy-6-metoxy-1,4-benzoquinol methylase